MSMFEHSNYDQDYQTYLDWKDKQAELDKEYDLAEEYERDLQEEMREAETTGERCVREAQEEDVRQLAQVTVGGVYRYELEWLPETGEVRVEVDQFPDGSPLYLWYPDFMGTTEVLSKLMNIPEEKIRITGLTFFTKGDMLVALNYERRQFMNNMWRDYAAEGTAMQFNVEIVCPNNCYDASCDGTNCEFKPLRPHGVDGTQCDCSDCTLDYGLCSCGCGGNHQAHAEWLEEREKEKQAFVHETAKPEPAAAVEDDAESTSSVESVEEKESRLWSDFKLAIMVAMTALMMGAYICKVACF
jgi:hypothetical protein